MMKILKSSLAVLCTAAMLAGCGQQGEINGSETIVTDDSASSETEVAQSTNKKVFEGATVIELSDDVIMVDGTAISTKAESAVYADKDIVFYLEGQGFTYGEGEKEDEHSQAEADAHTVVHITKPGTYALSGQLSAGQIAVDLGEDAEEDPEAVVTLILNGVDITCSVAPGVIFYNVYECGSDDTETAAKDVDTTAAGANVIIADDTVNNVTGSYVARIYKSYELNEAGTEVIDNKKLHKYDAAFYSKQSMNMNGDIMGTGVLNINAENEGLDSELHLTINGGNINIVSGNDGINTNEDGVSVTTVNGGVLNIKVSGETGEGDGIDSNGWLVINGGTVLAQACSFSGDAGIDSDMGIHINGGTVIASGNMLDHISESEQNYVVFSFASNQNSGTMYTMKNENGDAIFEYTPENKFSYLIISDEKLTNGTYTFWSDNTQLAASTSSTIGGMMGFPGGFGGMQPPKGMTIPEGMQLPDGAQMPQGGENPIQGKGERPEGQKASEGMTGGFQGGKPDGFGGPGGFNRGDFNMGDDAELSKEFEIVEGGNYFTNVSPVR